MYKPWAIEVYGEADWRMGMIPDLPKPKYTFYDKQIQYNQLDTWATDCTLYASMWAVSDLTGKVWTIEERREIHNMAVNKWLSATEWRWLHKAVDLVRKNSSNLSTLRVRIWSDDFWNVMQLWYSVVTGYKTSRQHREDAQDNCIIEDGSIADWWLAHCIRLFEPNDSDYMIDNYYEVKKCNVYKHNVLKEHIANWLFFNYWYIYFETIPMPINLLPLHIKAGDNPDYYNEILAREKECWDAWDEWFRPIFSNYIDWLASKINVKMNIDLMLVRTGLWKLIDENIINQLRILWQKFND